MDTTKQIYEIGYLIVSSIPEEKVPAEVEMIDKLVQKEGGEIIAGEKPVLTPLAYVITKEASGKHVRYSEGYFGWVKFEVATENVEAIKKSLDTREDILRYLLITTVRESTLAPQKIVAPKEEGAPAVEETKTASVEELDKTIDEMVK